jgi:hypothetical protein
MLLPGGSRVSRLPKSCESTHHDPVANMGHCIPAAPWCAAASRLSRAISSQIMASFVIRAYRGIARCLYRRHCPRSRHLVAVGEGFCKLARHSARQPGAHLLQYARPLSPLVVSHPRGLVPARERCCRCTGYADVHVFNYTDTKRLVNDGVATFIDDVRG